MKRFLLVYAFLLPVFVCASYKVEKKIDKLVRPYEKAIEVFMALDASSQLDDYMIYQYFVQSKLSTKHDRRKFDRSLKKIKALAKMDEFSSSEKNKINFLIDNLDKVQNFIVQYATTDYAYYDIAGYYHCIDEQQFDLVAFLMESSTQFMLPSMHGRGLYKFMKKINLDLRRLNTLSVDSDSIRLKVNQLRNKLLTLKSVIAESYEYQQQERKTRWLKAIGLLTPVIVFLAFILTVIIVPGNISAVLNMLMVTMASVVAVVVVPFVGINLQDVYEAKKYNIPVYDTSFFSIF